MPMPPWIVMKMKIHLTIIGSVIQLCRHGRPSASMILLISPSEGLQIKTDTAAAPAAGTVPGTIANVRKSWSPRTFTFRSNACNSQSAGNGDNHVEQRIQQRFARIGVLDQIDIVANADPVGRLENVVDGEAVVEGIEDGVGLKNNNSQDPGQNKEVRQHSPAFCPPSQEGGAARGNDIGLFRTYTGNRHTSPKGAWFR